MINYKPPEGLTAPLFYNSSLCLEALPNITQGTIAPAIKAPQTKDTTDLNTMIRNPNEGHGLMPWGRGGESTPPRHNPSGKKIEVRTKIIGAAYQKHTRGSKNVAGCALRTAARLL